jgi:acyl transferase domain-containing protein
MAHMRRHCLLDGQHGSVYSPDGLCQVFDTKANGYVKAEAVNAVILKRLDDALADGDPIRAIIRGSASNSNGATVGISTPSMEQQVACIRAAYARAGITDTNATSYIECHGTGTQVRGDYERPVLWWLANSTWHRLGTR